MQQQKSWNQGKNWAVYIYLQKYIYIFTNSVPGLTIAKMMSSNNITKLIMKNVDTVNLK
jgi:hypothetical protein